MSKNSVVLCTNSGLCSSIILKRLIESDDIDVVGVFLSTKTRTKDGPFLSDIRHIVKHSGFNYLLYLAFSTSLFELAQVFWPKKILNSTPKLISKNQIPFFKSNDINSAEAIEWLRSLEPDYLLSGFFNLKLGKKVLAIAKGGAVNIHPSLLPNYKGVDPVFYYFLNGESTVGVTLHRMDEEYDTGEILAQANMQKEPGRSVLWHNTELFRHGTALFLNWIKNDHSSLDLINTPVSDNYDSWPSPMQVRKLKGKLFSWRDLIDQARRRN